MSIQNEIAEGAEASDTVALDAELAKPLSEVWTSLTQPAGIEALFGEGVQLGAKGDPWHGADGTYGVTRSYHPAEQIRISWHAHQDAPATVVDVQFREAARAPSRGRRPRGIAGPLAGRAGPARRAVTRHVALT